MGLFSSVLHLRDVDRDRVLSALDAVMQDSGFVRADTVPVPRDGPSSLASQGTEEADGPYYLISPLSGRWATIIEACFVSSSPHLSDLGNRISGKLSSYALFLMVHDDDVFYYNLERNGEPLDGYNSCPQYFEHERLADSDIESQRHAPELFQPLLPNGRTVAEIATLLQRGWWSAYDSGTLDEDGVPQNDDDMIYEPDRMTALGTLLGLHSGNGEYPFTAWGDSEEISWTDFLAVRYRANS